MAETNGIPVTFLAVDFVWIKGMWSVFSPADGTVTETYGPVLLDCLKDININFEITKKLIQIIANEEYYKPKNIPSKPIKRKDIRKIHALLLPDYNYSSNSPFNYNYYLDIPVLFEYNKGDDGVGGCLNG